MSEKKVVSVRVAIALGIICIVLVVGLIGAFSFLERTSGTGSQNSQDNFLGWAEGDFFFNLTSGQDVNFTVSTAGFRSVTFTIDAWSLHVNQGFRVFVGFMTVNTTVDYQVYYDAQSYPLAPPFPSHPYGYIFPPWSYYSGYPHWPASFRQTYDVTFSKAMVWIWNNCTAFSASVPIWGNVYYYLTV